MDENESGSDDDGMWTRARTRAMKRTGGRTEDESDDENTWTRARIDFPGSLNMP